MRTHVRGALRQAHDRIARLGIADPDPDRYDEGHNAAIRLALKEIERVAADLEGIRQRRHATIRVRRELHQ